VCQNVALVFGSARIRDLRSFLVSDPRMDVDAPFRAPSNDIKFGLQQTLADDNPMTEVTAKLQPGEMLEQSIGDPGIVKNSSTMSFVSHWNSDLRFELESLAKVLLRLFLREPITAGVAVNGLRLQSRGPFNVLAKAADMIFDCSSSRNNLGDVFEPMLVEKPPESRPIRVLRQDVLNTLIFECTDFRKERLPRFGNSPQVPKYR